LISQSTSKRQGWPRMSNGQEVSNRDFKKSDYSVGFLCRGRRRNARIPEPSPGA